MTPQRLAFSPSIVLLVHETGVEVLRQLGIVLGLASLHAPLAAGIGLLTVDAGAGEPQARARWLPPADAEPGPPVPLARGLFESVRRVRARATLDLIKRAGYTVGAAVQVYVVGAADDPWLGAVLTAARRALEADGLAHTICYLLDSPPSPGTLVGPGIPAGDPMERELADFTFVFGDRITFPSPEFVSEEAARHYLIAQALFALVTTGISLDGRYMDLVGRQSSDPADRAGSLRTCLVSFPRVAIEQFCAAGIGRELIACCLDVLSRGRVDEAEAVRERERARETIAEVWHGLDDTVERPGSDPEHGLWTPRRWARAAHHRWPTLEVPGTRQAAVPDRGALARDQLVEATGRLFERFGRRDVDAQWKQVRRRAWTDVADERARQAPQLSLTWSGRVQAAWLPLRSLLTAHVRERFDERWAAADRRMALARVFAGECEARLGGLLDLRVALREQHHGAYLEGRARFRELADDWIESIDRASFVGSDGASSVGPFWPGQRPGAAGAGPGGIAGETPDPEPRSSMLSHRLDGDEEQIALALRWRARNLRARVPSRASAITLALLTLATLGLPAAFLQGVPAWPVAAASAGASGLLGWLAYLGLSRLRRGRARRAESDLLRFYCLCYAYRGEQQEDRLRSEILGPVEWWVQRVLRRLEDVESFLERVRDLLQTAKLDAETALFASPAASFDVLVAEGGELRPLDPSLPAVAGQVTLDEVLGAIRERAAESTDPSRLLPGFLASFRGGPALLEMTEEELQGHVLRWVREQVLPRCLGSAAPDVSEALGRPEVQRRLADQLQSPLFDLRGVMQAAERYVCGRWPSDGAQQVEAAALSGRPIPVNEGEWWLLAALFADTTGTALERDLLDSLFPARPDAPLGV